MGIPFYFIAAVNLKPLNTEAQRKTREMFWKEHQTKTGYQLLFDRYALTKFVVPAKAGT
jgi:hypothetical protein